MSFIQAEIDIIVVDSATTLLSLLDNLVSLAVGPPSLYLDLEGVKLGRHGSISIISLHITSIKKLYLIDIHRLGKAAFSTTNSSATSLKTVLESPTMPKVIFDTRNNSDALFRHFQISVDGIEDLQLMELVTRKGSKDFLAERAKCIEKDSPISTAAQAEWQRAQEGASRLYDPQNGGRYEIFNERPMRPEIVQYCAGKVALLPGLYNVYNAKLRLPGGRFWQVQVEKATKDWIKLSQRPGCDGHTNTKARGPWHKREIDQAMDDWNEEVMFDSFTDDHDEFADFFDHEDEDADFYDHEEDGMSARDCIGWEEDMVKNGEYF